MPTSAEDKSCYSAQPPESEAAKAMLVTATVLRQDSGGVWLYTPVSTSCSGCKQQDSCSSGLVAKAMPVRQQQLFLGGVTDLLPGQQVEISLAPGAVLTSALLVYFLPLCTFIAALMLGQLLQWHELVSLGWAALATALIFRVVKRVEQARAGQLEIRLVRVLPDITVVSHHAADAGA